VSVNIDFGRADQLREMEIKEKAASMKGSSCNNARKEGPVCPASFTFSEDSQFASEYALTRGSDFQESRLHGIF